MDKLMKHHLKFVLDRYTGEEDIFVGVDAKWLCVTDLYSGVRVPLQDSPFSEEGLLTGVRVKKASQNTLKKLFPPNGVSELTELADTGLQKKLKNGTEVKILGFAKGTVLLDAKRLRQLVPRGVRVRFWQQIAGTLSIVYLTFGDDEDVRAVLAQVSVRENME